MAGRAFVAAKDVFNDNNGNISIAWEWRNDEKQFFLYQFNFISEHLCLQRNISHLKLR